MKKQTPRVAGSGNVWKSTIRNRYLGSTGPRFCERGPVEALVCADAVGSKTEEPAALRLQPCGNCDPLGRGRDALGQMHVPAAFAPVHLQNQAGVAGRVVDGCVHEQKIRSHLGDGDGTAVDQQSHFHLGGVAALTR